jgi:protein ImuA
MNKYASDSALLPSGLPAGAWGHALARMRTQGEEESRTALADVLMHAMPANALHEIFAASAGDAASASGFSLMLAAMLDKGIPDRESRALFLIREYRRGSGRYYPPGLAELGIDPARCFNVDAPDTLAALKATADIARSGAAGVVLIELAGNPRLLDLTASRRLALAAEQTGTAVLLLRLGARESPSAAYSRWQVASAKSVPLLADAPGLPAFTVTLLRHRRMAAGQSARLMWNMEEQKFDEQNVASKSGEPARAAAFGPALSLALRRTADPRPRRAA